MRPAADEHEDAVGGQQPGADAAVAGEERVHQLAGLPHQLGRRRPGPQELFAGQQQEDHADRQPQDHRSSPLTTLPFGLRGSASRTSTCSGALNLASRARTHSRTSSGSSRAPGRGTTQAFTTSPYTRSGTPTTAASRTPGWPHRTSSTSTQYTFSPPRLIMSLIRSLIVT